MSYIFLLQEHDSIDRNNNRKMWTEYLIVLNAWHHLHCPCAILPMEHTKRRKEVWKDIPKYS